MKTRIFEAVVVPKGGHLKYFDCASRHVIEVEDCPASEAMAASEVRNLNLGVGGLGEIEIVEWREITPKFHSRLRHTFSA